VAAMQQIGDWLKKLGMSEYAERVAKNDIEIDNLTELTITTWKGSASPARSSRRRASQGRLIQSLEQRAAAGGPEASERHGPTVPAPQTAQPCVCRGVWSGRLAPRSRRPRTGTRVGPDAARSRRPPGHHCGGLPTFLRGLFQGRRNFFNAGGIVRIQASANDPPSRREPSGACIRSIANFERTRTELKLRGRPFAGELRIEQSSTVQHSAGT
jgi:hypothetical protein